VTKPTKVDQEVVRLMSVHKAKGNEAERVWILKPELFFCGPKGKEDLYSNVDSPSYKQERNLLYVAITRSLSHITFLGEDFREESNFSIPGKNNLG